LNCSDTSNGSDAFHEKESKTTTTITDNSNNHDKIHSMFRMSNRIVFDLDEYLCDDDNWRDMVDKYENGQEDENVLIFNLLKRLNDSSKLSTESHRERLHSLEESAIISRKITLSKDKVYRYNSSAFTRQSSLQVSLQRSSIIFNDNAVESIDEDDSDEEEQQIRVDADDEDSGDKPFASISDDYESIGQQVASNFIANLVDGITDQGTDKRVGSIDRGVVRFNSKNMFRENSKTVEFYYDDTEEISLTNRSEGRRSRTQSADQSHHSSDTTSSGEEHLQAVRLPEFTIRKYSQN